MCLDWCGCGWTWLEKCRAEAELRVSGGSSTLRESAEERCWLGEIVPCVGCGGSMLKPRVRGRLGSSAPMSMSKVRVDGSEVSPGNTVGSPSNGSRERRVRGERSCTCSSAMSRLRGGQKLLRGRILRFATPGRRFVYGTPYSKRACDGRRLIPCSSMGT